MAEGYFSVISLAEHDDKYFRFTDFPLTDSGQIDCGTARFLKPFEYVCFKCHTQYYTNICCEIKFGCAECQRAYDDFVKSTGVT